MNDFKEKFERMKIAGSLASKTLDMLTSEIKEGISTNKIDKLGFEFIRDKADTLHLCITEDLKNLYVRL